MKIAALVHFYVPFRNAGSETMLHGMLKYLADAGHEVRVCMTSVPEAPFRSEFQGITVYSGNEVTAQQFVQDFEPDVLVTQQQNTARGIRLSRKIGCPSVFVMHNDHQPTRKLLSYGPDLVVYNTRWMANKYTRDGIVIHPPVWRDQHRVQPGNCVTLVNLTEAKGANLFYRLARQMPDTNFLGVIGGYGDQIVKDLPNVDIVEHTSDMKNDVWSRTGVLLMPSVYESYGLAGVEALASGIPVIAHPTPGLLEGLSYAGSFADRDDFEAWHSTTQALLEPGAWKAASELALRRSNQLDPSTELDTWLETIEGMAR